MVSETLVESSEVDVASVHILHDQSWSLGHWVSDHVVQIDDVHAAAESLQDLDFPSNLGLLDCKKQKHVVETNKKSKTYLA